MASSNWQGFQIQLPGQDLLESARNILETLMTFLEVLKAVLDTLKTFLIAIPNPIQALVQALIALINTLFESLNRSGIYGYFDIPDPSKDPNFFKFVGGYQAFVQRFKGSLLDTRDPNRPQPISGATQSGFVLIVADAQGPLGLMRLIKILVQFFHKEELIAQARFAAPTNVKVLPMGSNKEPLTSLAKVFGATPTGVSLQWTLGGTTNPPDPGFNDLGSVIANEFIPPKWLIERSSTPINTEVDVGAGGVGRVTYMATTSHEDRGQPGQFLKQKVRLSDEYGEPVIKFDTYKVFTLTDDNGTLLDTIVNGVFGELGFVQFFDTDVNPDQVYYYRVRAFHGSLTMSGNSLNWPTAPAFNIQKNAWVLPWPGDVVMGHASMVFRIRVPKIPHNFDVLSNLRSLFLAAFSLNFHAPVTTSDQFSSAGVNIPPTPVSHIGYGSLTKQAGVLSAFLAQPVVSTLAKGLNVSDPTSVSVITQVPTDTITGVQAQVPWQLPSVQRQAGRLASIVGSALLEQGSGAISQFQSMMTGPFPKGSPKATTPKISEATNLSQLVQNITALASDGTYDLDTYNAYVQAFSRDPNCRLNILFAIRFVTNFTLGGTPPDWIQMTILKDVIPWSGQLLYELLAKIRAMGDAFRGVFAEISQFVDLIERKIAVLEQFIQFLLNILDFILSLEGGFFILSVPNTGGDIYNWFQLIDGAGGTPPPSGPGGYSAGVALAYLGPDVSAFATAFGLIF